MKLLEDGVQWGGPDDNWYYFYWWNWLSKGNRFFGLKRIWYDGPIVMFGFWWLSWVWSTYWSEPPKEYRTK